MLDSKIYGCVKLNIGMISIVYKQNPDLRDCADTRNIDQMK